MVETLNKPSASITTSASTSTFINYHKAQEDYGNSTPSTSRNYESNQAGNLDDDDDDDEIPPIPPPKDIESPRRVPAPTSYSYSSALDQSFGLPEGMDVREALAQCEDPALGWSLQFWATIADPVTGHVFFACPATGTCSWEPPIGAFLLPRQADGEWWELADPTRSNRSYYYNTMTGVTQWTRPTGNAFVIPLGLIQQTALPPRPASAATLQPRTNTPAHLSPNKRTLAPPLSPEGPIRAGPRPPPSPRRPDGGSPSKATGSKQLGTVDEASTDELSTQRSMRDLPPRRIGSGTSMNENDSSSSKSPTTPPTTVVGQSMFSKLSPKEPIRIESIRTKRLSTGLHPLLPPNISSQINSLQTPNSTKQFFATRRTGLTRQKVPVDRIMEWQRTPITAPILVISHPAKDAVTTFKIIQHVMNERERPVDIPRPPRTTLAGGKRDGDESGDKMAILEELRWVVQLGVSSKEMRDEVYCQLVKQLTKNKHPNPEAMILGFQMFCVLVNSFAPSATFEPLVKAFLQVNAQREDSPVGIMAKYCTAKLEVLITQAARGKVLTIGEIEAASDAAFYPSVYGESLERIMNLQQRSYPTLPIPVILPFLADGILALGGTQSEGIFRIPGDNESVSELKSRMDRGHYQLSGIDDPHVAASLFKLWLRELESPIVPIQQYNTCLSASKSITQSIEFVRQLPVLNRRVLVFVISFFQIFLQENVVETTKMTASNLALVLAPNLLRTTSDSLTTVFTNSAFESKFVLNLLEHLDPGMIDPDYIPEHGRVSS